jgi:hypothetical protein
MKKKKSSRPAAKQQPKKATKNIHFLYVVLAVWIAGTALAYTVVTSGDQKVLDAKTQLAKKSKAGIAQSNAGSGNVGITITGEDRSTTTEILIDTETGNAVEIDDESGDSNTVANDKAAQKLLKRAQRIEKKTAAKLEKKADKAEKKATKRKNKKVRVLSEDGTPLKVKKDRKNKILVLPAQAIEALLKNGIIQSIDGTDASGSAVVYTRTNGTPVYLIQGSSEEKIFGAFPVTLTKTVTVSAEDGTVTQTDMSLKDKILSIISF